MQKPLLERERENCAPGSKENKRCEENGRSPPSDGAPGSQTTATHLHVRVVYTQISFLPTVPICFIPLDNVWRGREKPYKVHRWYALSLPTPTPHGHNCVTLTHNFTLNCDFLEFLYYYFLFNAMHQFHKSAFLVCKN